MEKELKDTYTLLIQGRIENECLSYYLDTYQDKIRIIISTWDDFIFSREIHSNVKVITSRKPQVAGYQNYNYQLFSTINGLLQTETDYVIKARGDEYYNIDKILHVIDSHFIYSIPIFFRPFSVYPYHISDHLIFGKTQNLKDMFLYASHIYLNDSSFLNSCESVNSCESGLTRAYLRLKGFNDFENLALGKKNMIEHFKIFSLDDLKPYKARANGIKGTPKIWHNDFNARENRSIDNLEHL